MLTKKDHKLFDVAKHLARTSNHFKARVGACITDGSKVLSVGVNGRKSHPLQQKYNKLKYDDDSSKHLLHAEMEALVRVKKQVDNGKDLSVYVYREMGDGHGGMSRPCVPCMAALKDFGIKNIYYSTNDGFVYEKIQLDHQ